MTTTAPTWHHLPRGGVWLTTTCRRTVWWRERSDGAGVTFT